MSRFQDLLATGKPVLVDAYAEWCAPCKAMAPGLVVIAHACEGSAHVVKVDIDRNHMFATTHQVRGVPTLLLFKNGRVIWRHSGVIAPQAVIDVVLNAAKS